MSERKILSPGERIALERKIQERMAKNPEYKSHVENKLNQIKTNNIMNEEYKKIAEDYANKSIDEIDELKSRIDIFMQNNNLETPNYRLNWNSYTEEKKALIDKIKDNFPENIGSQEKLSLWISMEGIFSELINYPLSSLDI